MQLKKRLTAVFLSLSVGLLIFLIGSVLISLADVKGSTELTYLPLIQNPSPTETPTPIVEPNWLEYLNGFRTASGLMALTENADWSEGGRLHGRYMVKNDVITHNEDPNNQWYTLAGAEAADHGNIYVSSTSSASFDQAIDWWLRAPFHAVPLLDPELQITGFGVYTETASTTNGFDWQMGATIDVERGRNGVPDGTTFPIYFPADNSSTTFTRFAGNEYPDPLSSCSGYSDPVGFPIFVQIGAGDSTIDVTATRLQEDGMDIDHCVIHEENYVSGDSFEQSTGRIILAQRDVIVIVPRNPLQAGSNYQVNITNDGAMYSWQFSVDAGQNKVEPGYGSAP